MRKLITMFLTINVGMNWAEETIHNDLIDKTNKNAQNKDPYLNTLYDLDFINLSNVLFTPKRDIFTQLNKILLKEKMTDNDFQKIKRLRKSNWDKYFTDYMDIKSEHLKKKWEIIYELRCKVAHNLYLAYEEYEKVNGICTEINTFINNALSKLDEISIPEKEKEHIKQEYMQNQISCRNILDFRGLAMTKLEDYLSSLSHQEISNLCKSRPDFLASFIQHIKSKDEH